MPPLGAGFLFRDLRVTTTTRAGGGGFLGAGTSPGLTRPKAAWGSGSCPWALSVSVGGSPPHSVHGRRWAEAPGAAGCSAFGGARTGAAGVPAVAAGPADIRLQSQAPEGGGVNQETPSSSCHRASLSRPPHLPPRLLVGITFPAGRGESRPPAVRPVTWELSAHTVRGKLVLQSSRVIPSRSSLLRGPTARSCPEMDSSGPQRLGEAPPQWPRSRSSPLQASRPGGCQGRSPVQRRRARSRVPSAPWVASGCCWPSRSPRDRRRTPRFPCTVPPPGKWGAMLTGAAALYPSDPVPPPPAASARTP